MCSSHSPIYIGAQIILYTYCIIKKIILTSVSLIDLQITNQIIEILHHQEHPFLSFLFAKRPIYISQTINFQVLLLCTFVVYDFFYSILQRFIIIIIFARFIFELYVINNDQFLFSCYYICAIKTYYFKWNKLFSQILSEAYKISLTGLKTIYLYLSF
jgi:hypothetical protein